MKKNRSLMATAAAALFVAGSVAGAQESESTETTEAKAEQVKCEGVNSCQAKSACSTKANSCAGKNSCARQGFLMLTAEECTAAKAKIEAEDKAKEAQEEVEQES